MAASSSVASSVVELRTAAELDTATSAMFFLDDDGAGAGAGGGSFSWPEAEKTMSRLTRPDTLRKLCDKYEIPAGYTPRSAGGRAACRTPASPEDSNAICVYAEALEAGMRLPLHEFYVVVLRHCGLAPSQLAPNAWRYMAGFVLLCRDAGVEPLLSVFFFFFSICTHKGDSMGWHHFKPYALLLPSGDRRRLFTGRMPRFPEWKFRFFFLEAPSTMTWLCPVQWGKPSRAAVRKPVVTTATETAVLTLLKRAGSSGIDIMQFLDGRSLPIGHQAALTPPLTAVKVEAAAAGSTPTRKRKLLEIVAPGVPARGSQQSYAGTFTPPGSSPVTVRAFDGEQSATRGLVDSMARTFQLAHKAMAEVEEKEHELQVSKGELALLKEELRTVTAEHAAHIAQLKEELEKAKAERAAEVRAVEVSKGELALLKEELRTVTAEHAADIAQLKEALQQARDLHAAEVSRQVEEHQKETAADIARFKEELEKAKAERVAEVRAVEAEGERALIRSQQESSSMMAEFYARGLRDMKQLAVTLYGGIIDLSELTTNQLQSKSGSQLGFPSAEERPNDQ